MKIDEGCINHNAVKLIDELTECAYDVALSGREDENVQMYLAMTMGNIIGVIEMAKAMKEVLRQ